MSAVNQMRGFTLLEVLLAIVLVGSASVIFAVNMDSILEKDPLAELERSFVLAQTEGRMMAFEDRQSLELSWDDKANRFVLVDQSVVSSYEVEGLEDKDVDLEVSFFFQEPSYRGDSFDKPSWYEVESVVFFADATSAQFKVLLKEGVRERELVIEPFTGFVSQRSG
jgi:prepilin-type N-terminal cleavage/methylation domain-containing protein